MNQPGTATSILLRMRQGLLLAALLAVGVVSFVSVDNAETANASSHGGAVRDGFNANVLPANDDGSTEQVPIGFPVNFFGDTYSFLHVNNNGNVTFDGSLSTFTPFGLQGASRVIIAPFFGDVDTRSGNVVSYGQGTVGGRPAFGANWPNVGCYSQRTHVLNNFQTVLVDRSDVGPGDFDIEFNYDQIQWEAGTASSGDTNCLRGSSARVGFSNGTTESLELPGSGVNGAFLDSNATTGLIHNSLNSLLQDGRYRFEVRNGVAPTGGSISGKVFGNGVALPGAFVQVCDDGGGCRTIQSNALGDYSAPGLHAGIYDVTAFPPGGTNFTPDTLGPINLPDGVDLVDQDLFLQGPTPPAPGTTITSRNSGVGGIPVIYWGEPITVTTTGCLGGVASFDILVGGSIVRSVAMTEGPPGTYSGTTPPLRPIHGSGIVIITIDCPSGPDEGGSFNIYIDPSGVVVNQLGDPIVGATVTLLRSDSAAGPFEIVPDGSGIMSPANRTNPDTTDAVGHFGWDVIAGFYVVEATAPDCVNPDDAGDPVVSTDVLTIPPPVTDLVLVLECDVVGPPDPPDSELQVSSSDDRSSPIALQDAVLAGSVFIYLDIDPAGVDNVVFFIDGVFQRQENIAPYDFAGGGVATASGFSVAALPEGPHTVVANAHLTGGGMTAYDATFEVETGSLQVSTSPDRSSPIALQDAVLDGSVFIYLDIDPVGVSNVEFFVDGVFQRQENIAPYDLAGGSVATANGFSVGALSEGPHTVVANAHLVGGGTAAYDATFEVENSPLLVSTSPDRSSPILLQGAVLVGPVYVFLDVGPDGVSSVEFLLDGVPARQENFAPYDLAGGSVDTAVGFDEPGVHVVTAIVNHSGGGQSTTEASFEILPDAGPE